MKEHKHTSGKWEVKICNYDGPFLDSFYLSMADQTPALPLPTSPPNHPPGAGSIPAPLTTMNTLRAKRPWIAFIDDERNIGNSIIVGLAKGWCFEKEKGCGVRGFDTIAELKSGTSKSAVYLQKPNK